MYSKIKSYVIGSLIREAESFHQSSRITLLFNISFAVLILGLIATSISLVVGTYPVLVPALGNVLLSIVILLFLRKNRFEVSAVVYLFALFLLLFGNLILNDGVMHIGSPFWIILLNILVMYILGIRWGIFYLVLSTLGFSYYILFVFEYTLSLIDELSGATFYTVIYETIFALSLLGYIIATILKSSKESDKLLKEQNKELLVQYEEIQLSNEEKTVLLKEIHHRVKNNLQIIISLMRLQTRDIKNEEAIDMFRETMNRVLTMAMIHEKVYQSEELSRIDLQNYFVDLSNDLIDSYQTDFEVDFDYVFELDNLDLESIVPLALIFNELFTNSLKHAFDGIEQPKISLSLVKDKTGEILLSYSDNGCWKDEVTDSSFGLELIDSLSEQIEADVLFEKRPNAYYEFRF